MVVLVKVGNRSDKGVFVNWLLLRTVGVGGLVGHVVDMVGLVRLAVGVHHGGVVSPAREAFFLAVPLLVAVSADDVGVGRGVVAGRAGVVPGLELTIAGPEGSDLFDFLLGQLFPDDLSGFFWLQFGLDGGDLVEPLVIILDGLQVAGHFHALIEGGFFSL